MAEQSSAAPAPPSAGGFKLKLKLGGGSSSTTVSAAQPSSPTTNIPASEPPAGIPTQASSSTSTSTSALAESSGAAAARARNDDSSMALGNEDSNVDDDDDQTYNMATAEIEARGGDLATSKKPTAKSRMPKTSTPAAATDSTAPGLDNNSTMGEISMIQGDDPDASVLSHASPGPSTSTRPESTKYETSIGSIVLPTSSSSTAGPSKKRRSTAAEGGATGLGRGWRKGLKGYQRGDLNSPGPGAGRGETVSPSPGGSTIASTSSRKRKSQTTAGLAASGVVDESSLDRNADPEDFVPAMAPSSGLATSEKWANGLPGGNEQSRLTASMANAVNRQFPVGPPPKTGSAFLQPQPLDKSTPPPRSWKKIKREIVGPSGIPFSVTIWQGDNESKYADYMVEHPRPPPVDKKATAVPAIGVSLEAGSPVPEGSYPPSEGTPADGPQENGLATASAGRSNGRARGKAVRAGGPRKKPGPPKKNKALPPPIIGSLPLPQNATISSDQATDSTQLLNASAAPSQISAEASDAERGFQGPELATASSAQPSIKSEEPMDSPMPAA